MKLTIDDKVYTMEVMHLVKNILNNLSIHGKKCEKGAGIACLNKTYLLDGLKVVYLTYIYIYIYIYI